MLDVLTYNTFLRPTTLFWLSDDQDFRAQHIASAIAAYTDPATSEFRDFDVVVLNEAFDDDVRDDHLEPGLRAAGFRYQTEVAGSDEGIEQDSGVFIASRWPIIAEDYLVYDEDVCEGFDCQAEKGAVYAKIDKDGRQYHVFGTHLQAGWSNQWVRESQLDELAAFIADQAIPADEPVIMAGDMNITRAASHYADMKTRLEAVQPWVDNDPNPQTCDNKPDAFPYYTIDPTRNDYGDGDVREYLDYVLYGRDYKPPVSELSFNKTVPLTTKACQSGETSPCLHDLSDHYGVHGRFVFRVPSALEIVSPAPGESVALGDSVALLAKVRDVLVDHPDSRDHDPNGTKLRYLRDPLERNVLRRA